MGGTGYRKRDFLKAALLATFGAPVFAQEQRLFGVKLPKQLMQLIPAKPLNIAMMVDSVIRMENDADRKGLPDSPLQRNKGERLLATEDSVYQLVLPRLVALIDRSEELDLGLANEAGSLLAELHASQHVLPDGLLSLPLGLSSGAPSVGQQPIVSPLAFAMQSVGSISLPDVPAPPPAPEKADEDIPLNKAKNFESLKTEYARLFRSATVRPEHKDSTDWHLTMMQKSKARYQAVSDDTRVPWYFIAVCHALEASFNFRAHLHNGDFPLSARTRQVPAGRPTKWLPPSDWESSARDAMRLLGFTGQSDWSLERTLYRIEAYNGFGYRPHGIASPYLWSFSNHYLRGKYVADGKWSPTAKSQQCGAAVMLKVLSDAGEIEWPAN